MLQERLHSLLGSCHQPCLRRSYHLDSLQTPLSVVGCLPHPIQSHLKGACSCDAILPASGFSPTPPHPIFEPHSLSKTKSLNLVWPTILGKTHFSGRQKAWFLFRGRSTPDVSRPPGLPTRHRRSLAGSSQKRRAAELPDLLQKPEARSRRNQTQGFAIFFLQARRKKMENTQFSRGERETWLLVVFFALVFWEAREKGEGPGCSLGEKGTPAGNQKSLCLGVPRMCCRHHIPSFR